MDLKQIDMRQLQLLAQQGKHTDTFMATFFGVKLGEWMKWREENPEIEAKLRDWRAMPTAIAEAALFSLVDGTAEAVETTYEVTGDYITLRNIETDEIISSVQEYRKRVKVTRPIPSIASIKFFLTNVAEDKWRERVEVTDESKTKMAKLILEARGRSAKFNHQKQLEEANAN